MLAQGNNLWLRGQGGSRRRSRTQDQKTRTVSTCWSNPGGFYLILSTLKQVPEIEGHHGNQGFRMIPNFGLINSRVWRLYPLPLLGREDVSSLNFWVLRWSGGGMGEGGGTLVGHLHRGTARGAEKCRASFRFFFCSWTLTSSQNPNPLFYKSLYKTAKVSLDLYQLILLRSDSEQVKFGTSSPASCLFSHVSLKLHRHVSLSPSAQSPFRS